jgi:hypothetical protein
VPLAPGDEITVILYPAPGALPELPGFGGDDQGSVTCCPATGVVPISGGVAELLEQNIPNPFLKSTVIAFSVTSALPVKLEVFDLLGRRLRTLIDGAVYEPGRRYTASWDGRKAESERLRAPTSTASPPTTGRSPAK